MQAVDGFYTGTELQCESRHLRMLQAEVVLMRSFIKKRAKPYKDPLRGMCGKAETEHRRKRFAEIVKKSGLVNPKNSFLMGL